MTDYGKIPWTKVKAEYMNGVTPKEIGIKYGVDSKRINEKASREKWKDERATITKNLQLSLQDKIKTLSENALNILSKVMNDKKTSNKDKVSAARAILDVSGLKALKQEITGPNGEALIQKIYITPKEKKATDKHIDNVIG